MSGRYCGGDVVGVSGGGGGAKHICGLPAKQ